MLDQKDLITFGGYAVTALSGAVATFILAYITQRSKGKSDIEIAFAANREAFLKTVLDHNERQRARIDELEDKIDLYFRELVKARDEGRTTQLALSSHLSRCKGEDDIIEGKADDRSDAD